MRRNRRLPAEMTAIDMLLAGLSANVSLHQGLAECGSTAQVHGA